MKMMCEDKPKAPRAKMDTIHGIGGPCEVHANQLICSQYTYNPSEVCQLTREMQGREHPQEASSRVAILVLFVHHYVSHSGLRDVVESNIDRKR